MPSPPGVGTCQKTMIVAFVVSSLMVLVRNASFQEMTVLSVSTYLVVVVVNIMLIWAQSWDSVLIRFIWFVLMLRHFWLMILTLVKHCLDTWINQESSQGRCPMCRQGTRTRYSCFLYKGCEANRNSFPHQRHRRPEWSPTRADCSILSSRS